MLLIRNTMGMEKKGSSFFSNFELFYPWLRKSFGGFMVRLKKMARIALMTSAIMLLAVAAGFARSPKILVDKPEIDVGVIPEGKQKIVEAVFIVKNIGDTTLVIKKVKPG
jgi:hypothetical protein